MALGLMAAASLARAEPALPDSAFVDSSKQIQAGLTGLHVIPGASQPKGSHQGHTNLRILVPYGEPLAASAPHGNGETPASLACVYGLTAPAAGCNPQTLKAVATGGSRAIAIVDAFDYPTAAGDLAVFSRQFGLPAANLRVIYAAGSRPRVDPTGSWELEAAVDIEMAHALAPGAALILVEAASASDHDLYAAEGIALAAVAQTGGEVSNSWGAGESPDEASRQSVFSKAGVVVFAAAGDTPGVSMPAVLPNVVGVGGTQINRDSNGDFVSQTSWSETGGGLSTILPRPSFQAGVAGIVGTRRGTPDIAMVASPDSPVWIYDSTRYDGQTPNWTQIGGTSVAAPLAAALVNNAGTFKDWTTAELSEMYTSLGKNDRFEDIKTGQCHNTRSGRASAGYDLCTGIGAPVGRMGK